MKLTNLIQDLQPSATMTDRANAERCASRILAGANSVNPTCGEHGAIVNPTGACAAAMDKVVLSWMGKTEADAMLDAHKVRALHMAVGWNNSPSGALIYCVCKYGASHSDKGYAVGQQARAYNEYLANLEPDDRESILLLGHMEDLLSIKGSRSYVSLLNAPIVDRILVDGPGSFYRFLKEQEELARPGGGRIRRQIVAGAESGEVRACVRALAIIGDFFMWPTLRAIKYRYPDGSDPHILDMAPVYQEAYDQLGIAAANPRLVSNDRVVVSRRVSECPLVTRRMLRAFEPSRASNGACQRGNRDAALPTTTRADGPAAASACPPLRTPVRACWKSPFHHRRHRLPNTRLTPQPDSTRRTKSPTHSPHSPQAGSTGAWKRG